MKTDRLIEVLARGPVAADPRTCERRLAATTAAGLAIALLAMFSTLGLRADLALAAGTPLFWIKLALPLAIGAAAFAASARLARPGERAGGAAAAIAALLLLLWAAAAATLAAAPEGARLGLVAGSTALSCAISITALSLPAFLLGFVGLRSLAPTRPRAAGAAAGLLAGAAAAAAYALHCNEVALPFLAVWYVLGMAAPALAGALAGPALLRWA